MRKIFCYSESLLEVFKRDFLRDCSKFFRASQIKEEHLGVPFEFKGNKWAVIGLIDDKETVCRNLDDNTVWAIDRVTVQKCLIGDTNVVFEKEKEKAEKRKLKPLAKTAS